MAELITVKASRTDGRVVLYEAHPDHPTGEAWVGGNGREVQVALTPAVQRKLNTGEMVEVQAKAEPPITGYDEMTAAQVLELMPAMSADEWAAVLAYEAAHKARKTILDA